MAALLCAACETTYDTAMTGPHLERLAQLGCEACGAAEPLRPVVRAVSAHEESEEHGGAVSGAPPSYIE